MRGAQIGLNASYIFNHLFGHMKQFSTKPDSTPLIRVNTGLLVNDPTLQLSQRTQSEYTDKVRGIAAIL